MDPCDTDWPIGSEVILTVTSLLQHEMFVSDLHVPPIVFCIKTDGWIICPLLVVVDHPIAVEARRLWVIKDGRQVRVLAKVFVQLSGIDCILFRK